MGRRRRREKGTEELTLEGFGAADLEPDSSELSAPPGDGTPEASSGAPSDAPPAADPPEEGEGEPLAKAPSGELPQPEAKLPESAPEAVERQVEGGEEAAADPSLSATPEATEREEDLPPDPGVLQRSFPPSGGMVAGSDGPELAAPDESPGDSPRMAPGESSPPPDPAGPTSETPVQEARVVSDRLSSDEPPPAMDRDEEVFSGLEDARALQREGRVQAALTLLREMVESDSRNVEARVELGVLLDRSGSHAAAVEHLEAAHRSVPDSVQILSALGAALTSLGRFDEAERELKRAQRLAPEDLLVRANLAIVSFRRGLYGHAESELRWICDRDEGNATVHFYRGEALNRLGRVDEALDAMKTVTRLDPGNARAFYTMGILYDKKHLPSEAAAMYRKARELGPR